jgi:uncharacterized protein YjbI with pentapeptide repeats
MKLDKVVDRLDVNASCLSGSVFNDVNISGASFENANRAGWTVNNANLAGLRVTNADLSGVTISKCPERRQHADRRRDRCRSSSGV